LSFATAKIVGETVEPSLMAKGVRLRRIMCHPAEAQREAFEPVAGMIPEAFLDQIRIGRPAQLPVSSTCICGL
jgi:hypothetical protein